MSIAETILGSVAFVIVLVVTAWAGRKGTTSRRGLMLGVSAGIAAALVVGFAAGFVRHVLPLSQIDYWLAGQVGKFISLH